MVRTSVTDVGASSLDEALDVLLRPSLALWRLDGGDALVTRMVRPR
jgi:hypothetical protein